MEMKIIHDATPALSGLLQALVAALQVGAPNTQAAPALPLNQQPPATPELPASAAPTTTPIPTAAPAYKIDDIMRAAVELSDKGKRPQLLDLLNQYEISMLTALQPDQYAAFANDLRGLGAKI